MDLETLRTKYKTQILEIAARNHVENVRIFGSVARGEATAESDIDFLVHLTVGATLLDLGGAYMDLEELLHCKIDLVMDDSVHWYIKERILNEAVVL